MKNSKTHRWLFSENKPQKKSKITKKTDRADDVEHQIKLILRTHPDIKFIGEYNREYQFHQSRRWRFDFAWVSYKVALEIDGMAYQAGGGRHNTDSDREKMNMAVSMGWRIFRFRPGHFLSDPYGAMKMISETIAIYCAN